MKIMIRADEGMVLTDGESYGITFDLAEGISPYAYTEIPKAEYEAKLKEETDE